ncbi:pilus assembly protein TadG-related protein [Jannaschia sp. R86511]|uniref:pilus assembly protein TadG-related protein n=1 Tax=Jannaschia sp. R86511 TaxID=3093853 RepID=UPI0036D28E65
MSGLGLTATSLAAMVLGCAVVGGVGQVAVARARADSAADLAALAAAARLARGDPADVACAAASQVVASGVTASAAVAGPAPAAARPDRVVACRVADRTVTVDVDVTVHVLGWAGVLTGTARAGPVPPGHHPAEP